MLRRFGPGDEVDAVERADGSDSLGLIEDRTVLGVKEVVERLLTRRGEGGGREKRIGGFGGGVTGLIIMAGKYLRDKALEDVHIRFLTEELLHTLGGDDVDLDRWRRKYFAVDGERGDDGVGSPVNDGVDLCEKGFAKDAIITG